MKQAVSDRRREFESLLTSSIDPLTRALEAVAQRAYSKPRFGVPLYSLRVLQYIQHVGKQQGLVGVAREMGVRKEGLSNVVTGLVEAGLVLKSARPAAKVTKRAREPLVLILTDAGRRKLRVYRELLQKEVQGFVEPFLADATVGDLRAVTGFLEALLFAEGVDADPDGVPVENLQEVGHE